MIQSRIFIGVSAPLDTSCESEWVTLDNYEMLSFNIGLKCGKHILLVPRVQIPPSFLSKLLLDVSIFLNPPVLRRFKIRKLRKSLKSYTLSALYTYYTKRLSMFEITFVFINLE